MSRLQDRYPNVPLLPLPEENPPSAEALTAAVQPYLNWTLVDMDTFPTDILLREPQGKDGQTRMIIITGPSVDVWLQHQQNAKL